MEEEFFSSVEAFNGGSVKASAVNGDVTFSEWEYDLTFKGGKRVKMNQVAVRRWKNGKIASERFYYTKEAQSACPKKKTLRLPWLFFFKKRDLVLSRQVLLHGVRNT